ASAGVAPNKFLAKIASGWQKPDGLTVIAPGRVEQFLQGLPVDALWGVGPVTARKLRARGIEKLVDVRAADPALLREAGGSLADWLQKLARGDDDRPVIAEYEVKSSGSENTFETDLTDLADVREEIAEMARRTAAWLVKRELYARTVTIKVRYSDFTTITRSHTEAATRDEDRIVERALDLLEKTAAGRRPVRLLGVSVHNLRDTPFVEIEGPPRLPFDEGNLRSPNLAAQDVPARHEPRLLHRAPRRDIAGATTRRRNESVLVTEALQLLDDVAAEAATTERLGDLHVDIAVRTVVMKHHAAAGCRLSIPLDDAAPPLVPAR